jgi:hypothetical protein
MKNRIRACVACITASTLSLIVSPACLDAANNAVAGAQWQQIPIGGGGFVTGIVYHPTENGLAYARTDVGGAYRWDEETYNWIPILDWVPQDLTLLESVISLAVDPNDPEMLYMVCGTSLDDTTNKPVRFLRSSDRGETFEVINTPFLAHGNCDGRSNGERLMVDPNKSNILYYGSQTFETDGGASECHLYCSTDKGSSWQVVSSFPVSTTSNINGISFVEFDKSSGSAGTATPVIYVGVSLDTKALYRSIDAGKTWTLVPNIPAKATVKYASGSSSPTAVLAMHGAFDGKGNFYVTFGDNPGPNSISWGGLYKLNISTGVWTDVSPTRDQGGFSGISINKANNLIAVSTIDRWWHGDRIYLSNDGAVTWKDNRNLATFDFTNAPYMNDGTSTHVGAWNWIGDVEIDPNNPDRILFVNGGGVWGTDEAMNMFSASNTRWEVFSKGIEEMCLCSGNRSMISPTDGAHLLVAFGDVGGFRFDNFDQSPLQGTFNPANSTNPSIDFAENVPLFIVRTHWGDGTSGSYSQDGGTTWTLFASEPSGVRDNYSPGGINVSPDASTLVWIATGKTPYYSTNRGASWTASTGAPAPAGTWMLMPLTSDRVNSKKFYLVDTADGKVYASTDGGKTFVGRGYVSSWSAQEIKAVPGFEDDIWVTAENNALKHSTNGGVTFTAVANVQDSRCVGFGKAAPGNTYPTIFLYGKMNDQWGIYSSTDEGASWSLLRENSWGSTDEIDGDPRIFGRLYVACGGRGLFYGDMQTAPEWLDAEMLGSSWFSSPWYGYVYHGNDYDGWIYSSTHGFQYGWDNSSDQSCYIWDYGSGSWWWTSKAFYPIIYSFKSGAWYYYISGKTSERVFWDYANHRSVGQDML